jgi:aminoglycoside 3-N-acetyltransferase
MRHTRKRLACDLDSLGVETGDLLFVHSSLRSIGPVAGGAETVVCALEDALGPAGLLLMPSFNLVPKDPEVRAARWDFHTSPSTVGWLTEFFRRMPGTVRSDHYSHSVAARGNGAATFVGGHVGRTGLSSPWDREPWGKTYGTDSPMYRAFEAGGKVLMLGVDYTSSTYVHLVEVLYWHRLLADDPETRYPWLDRAALGAHWDRHGSLDKARVGDAECRLFRIPAYVDSLLREVEADPEAYLKGWS